MMNHFLGEDSSYPGFCGSASAGSAAASAAVCSSSSADSGSEAEISSCPASSSRWTFSSASIYRLFRKECQQVPDGLPQYPIHHVEVSGERKHGENHDPRGALHLFTAR